MRSTAQIDLVFDPPGSRRRKPLSPVARERQRLNAAALRVLERLKQGPACNYELATPEIGGLRAIGRVHELQKAGYAITKEHLSGGTWRYALMEHGRGGSICG
jgi:hypothetical protein